MYPNHQSLQRDSKQTGCYLFPTCNHDIIFSRVIERVRLAAKIDEPIGFARHCGNNHRNFVATFGLALHDLRDAADTLRPRHRRAAKFHYDPGHGVPKEFRRD